MLLFIVTFTPLAKSITTLPVKLPEGGQVAPPVDVQLNAEKLVDAPMVTGLEVHVWAYIAETDHTVDSKKIKAFFIFV